MSKSTIYIVSFNRNHVSTGKPLDRVHYLSFSSAQAAADKFIQLAADPDFNAIGTAIASHDAG